MKELTCHRIVNKFERRMECGGNMPQTKWQPNGTQDPQLREYKCGRCGDKVYLVDNNTYLRKFGVKGGL